MFSSDVCPFSLHMVVICKFDCTVANGRRLYDDDDNDDLGSLVPVFGTHAFAQSAMRLRFALAILIRVVRDGVLLVI